MGKEALYGYSLFEVQPISPEVEERLGVALSEGERRGLAVYCQQNGLELEEVGRPRSGRGMKEKTARGLVQMVQFGIWAEQLLLKDQPDHVLTNKAWVRYAEQGREALGRLKANYGYSVIALAAKCYREMIAAHGEARCSLLGLILAGDETLEQAITELELSQKSPFCLFVSSRIRKCLGKVREAYDPPR